MICPICIETNNNNRKFIEVNVLIDHIRKFHAFLCGNITCHQNGCMQSFMKLFNYKRHLIRFHSISYSSIVNDDVLMHEFQEETSSPTLVSEYIPTIDFVKNAAVLYSTLKSMPKVTNSVSDLVMQVSSDIAQESSSYIIQKLNSVCIENNIETCIFEEVFNDLTAFKDSFKNFETAYRGQSYFESLGTLIIPKEYVLGERLENKNINGLFELHEIEEKFYYISIKDILVSVFKNSKLLDIMFEYKNKKLGRTEDLSNVQDGIFYQENFKSPNMLIGELFIDDIECGDSLSSSAGINSLGKVMFSFKDLPPIYSSNLNLIFPLLIFYSIDAKKYSYRPIFDPLIKELNDLYNNGLIVRYNEKDIVIKFAISHITGDNLGLNKILGYTESFISNFCCRICKMDKSTRNVSLVENVDLLRNKENYNHDLYECLSKNCIVNGIKDNSCLSEIIYFHVPHNMVLDCMHDLLEGVVDIVLTFVLEYFINNNFFTLEWFNKRILFFNYNSCHKKNKPSAVKKEKFNKIKLRQKAAQMWTLAKIMPFLIGSKIPVDNEYYDLLLILLEILDIVFAPLISINQTFYLQTLIYEHHKLYLSLDNKVHITPKLHFLTHYPRMIRYLGPPVRYWAMRYESSHQLAKQCVKSSNNHRNIALTVSKKSCAKLNDLFYSKMRLQNFSYGPGFIVKGNCQFPFLKDKVNLFKTRYVKIGDIVYKSGGILIYNFNTIDDSLFIFIDEVFVYESDAIIKGFKLNYKYHSEHYHSFVFEKSEDIKFVYLKDAYDHRVCNFYKINQLLYVFPKTKICKTSLL